MKKSFKAIVNLLFICTSSLFSQNTSIYHKGWIDFNKNGKMDLLEDSTQSVEKRFKLN
ncbi:MAG: hypothetical protein WCS79_00485 [Paludibacter sp.]|jgi:beta-glucosidase